MSAIRLPTHLFILFGILSISGCVGTASAPKSLSTQQTQSAPPPASISVTPGLINFGTVNVGAVVSQTVTISNTGESDLSVTQVSTTVTGLTVTGISVPVTVGPGKQFKFNLAFSPKTAGTVAGDVALQSNASNSPAAVTVNGTGMTATTILNTSASALSFGTIPVGTTNTQTVTLTNAGSASLDVSNISILGAGYSASGVPAGLILAPGQETVLHVTFSPQAIGSSTGAITLTTNAANSPTSLALTGGGIQAVSHSVNLSWNTSASGVASYNIYRGTISGGPYARINSSSSATSSYIDSAVQSGQSYYYVVTAVDTSQLESAYSNQVSVAVPTP